MIARLSIFLLLSVFFSASAWAQQRVPVQSGDHDGFTRLVLEMDPATPHEISTSKGLVRLVFPDRALRFSLDSLFTPISRQRLRGVRQGILGNGSLIELDLACACRVRKYSYKGRYLVVDILDEPGAANHAVVARATEPVSDVTAAVAEKGPAPEVPRTVHPADTNVYQTARAQLGWLPHSRTPDHDPSNTLPSAPAVISLPAAPEHDVEVVRNVLLEQLTRAAEQGLITFDAEPQHVVEPPPVQQASEHLQKSEYNPAAANGPELMADHVGHRAAERTPQQPNATPTHLVEPAPAGALFANDPQVSVVSVFDRDDPPDQNEAMNGSVCPPDDEFAVWNWVGDGPAFGQIAAARSALLGEFDLVDQQAVQALARLYVGLGFGREALMVLSAYGSASEETELLADLARTADRIAPARGGALDQAEGCQGYPALWHGAAFGIENKPDEAARAALFASFADLPLNQRRLLGPRLSDALLEAGDASAASRISDLLARAPGDHGPEQKLASARLGLVLGASTDDKAALLQLAEKSRVTGPEALSLLVDDLVSTGSPVPENLLLDLELAHFQNRNGAVADKLLNSRVRALISVGSADQALDLLAASVAGKDVLTGDQQKLTAAALLAYQPAADQPDTYIVRSGQHLVSLGADADADAARQAVARHYITIGMPGLAHAVLAPSLARGSGPAALIAAEAYLDEGNIPRALGLLSKMNSPEAAILKARASAISGDSGRAVRILRAAGSKPELVQEYAWQAGDWNVAAATAAPQRKELANYMNYRPSPAARRRMDAGGVGFMDEDTSSSLQYARELLSRSASARDLVRKATQAPLAPPIPE